MDSQSSLKIDINFVRGPRSFIAVCEMTSLVNSFTDFTKHKDVTAKLIFSCFLHFESIETTREYFYNHLISLACHRYNCDAEN
jgi:hypothetical protein